MFGGLESIAAGGSAGSASSAGVGVAEGLFGAHAWGVIEMSMGFGDIASRFRKLVTRLSFKRSLHMEKVPLRDLSAHELAGADGEIWLRHVICVARVKMPFHGSYMSRFVSMILRGAHHEAVMVLLNGQREIRRGSFRKSADRMSAVECMTQFFSRSRR